MQDNREWHASSGHDWRDEVAPDGVPLGHTDPDIDTFVDDMREMVRTVVECTVEPVRAFAEGFPRAFAYERRDWDGVWQDHSPRGFRYARRFWRR